MPEVLGLFIPILFVSIPFFAIWTKHQRKMAEMQMRFGVDENRYTDAYSRLEERVRVLERIVTERGFDVAAQIEALRSETPTLSARDNSPA